MTQAIRRFHDAFPGIDLTIRTATRTEGLRLLEGGESDLHLPCRIVAREVLRDGVHRGEEDHALVDPDRARAESLATALREVHPAIGVTVLASLEQATSGALKTELRYRFFDGLHLVCLPFDVTRPEGPRDSVRRSIQALEGLSAARMNHGGDAFHQP